MDITITPTETSGISRPLPCKQALTTCAVVGCASLVGLLLVGDLSAQPAPDSATLVRIAAQREMQFLREWREAWAKSEQDRHPISGTYLGANYNSRVIVNGKARFRSVSWAAREMSYDEAVERVVIDTRHYAKRQRTWCVPASAYGGPVIGVDPGASGTGDRARGVVGGA